MVPLDGRILGAEKKPLFRAMAVANAKVQSTLTPNVRPSVEASLPASVQQVLDQTNGTLLANTDAPINQTAGNTTDHNHWVTTEDVEHFLGDADTVHALLLVFGILVIIIGDKFPKLVSTVTSLAFALWCGLMVQQRQDMGKGFGGILPKTWEESSSLPAIAFFVAAGAAGALVHFAQKAALVVLTGGVFMLVSGSVLRLANINPTELYDDRDSMNMNSAVALGAFVVGMVVCMYLARKFHKIVLLVCSALIGTMLMISGISYFAQKDEDPDKVPVSLLDDLAHTFADVRSGKCHVFGAKKGGCDCGEDCKTEIIAWFICSALVLLVRYSWHRCNERRKYKLMRDDQDQRQELKEFRAQKKLQSVVIGKRSLLDNLNEMDTL
eukprot:GEMP01041100.1.p1 GENE.GEMP01041100.1~~GEMP01041100.1.p1  ORF type:complete len:382 (+),score=88.11 GEMP01041100.1:81-1226(+)